MTFSRVLVLRNAVTGAASFSNKGVDRAIAAVKAANPAIEIVERDLAKNPVPMLNEETCEAIRNFTLETDAQKEADKLATTLIEEIKSANLVIIGLPRYNFGVPATFKAYLDYVGRPRVTFAYGANGPEGLLPNIPVWFVTSAGGVYGDDYYTKWLTTVMPFLGLKTVKFLSVEGVAMGKADEALAKLDETVAEELKTLH